MSEESYYSVKMRAARGGAHISGAEKIVPASAVPKVASVLVERALTHAKGVPDFINLKVESQEGPLPRLKALKVTTSATRTAEEGRAVAAKLLRGAGIERIDEFFQFLRFAFEFCARHPEVNGKVTLVKRAFLAEDNLFYV